MLRICSVMAARYPRRCQPGHIGKMAQMPTCCERTVPRWIREPCANISLGSSLAPRTISRQPNGELGSRHVFTKHVCSIGSLLETRLE